MSDKPDRESQTEEPTDKRLSEAREKGNVPSSSEVPLAASFVALAGLVVMAAQPLSTAIAAQLGRLFDEIGPRHLESQHDVRSIFFNVSEFMLIPILPLVLVMIAAGIAAAVIQNPPSVSFDRLAPDFSRISPMAGLNRIYGARARVDFTKAAVKLFGGMALIWNWFEREKDKLALLIAYEPQSVGKTLIDALAQLIIEITVLCVCIAAADWYFARARWRRELRMTKEEVKREHKEAERDPALKNKMRSLALSRVRTRMMAAVPKATVIITNPTHLAIALRFVRSENDAPIVVAKGADLVALRIREIAAEHDIPIIEDRPLARAMFDAVKVDQKIPTQFYKAVAVIIHHLSRKLLVGSTPQA